MKSPEVYNYSTEKFDLVRVTAFRLIKKFSIRFQTSRKIARAVETFKQIK